MQALKQSTIITIKLGPFLDKTDGVTEETALTPAVEVSKNGGDFATRNSVTAPTHTAGQEGYYAVELDATDSNTLGRLRVKAHDSATHLPVWQDYMIMPANVWDSLFGADVLQVDLTQMGGIAQSATDLKDFADNGYNPATGKVVEVATLTGHTPQTGDSYALANGATGFTAIDTVVDAIKVITDALPDSGALTAIGTDTARLTAVRAAVLTDLINGGRLDLLIDAIKAVTDALPDAGALTAIGTDTARLTAVRAAILTDWINGGRLDLLLDAIPTIMRGTDSAALAVDLATHDGKLDGVVTETNSHPTLAEIEATTVLAKEATVAALNDLSTAQVNAEVDIALNTAIPASPTAGSINEVVKAQARSAGTIQDGAAAAGTLSTTQMTTDLTVSVADQFNGRIIIFANDTTTAALRGQATDITATTVSGSKLGFTALTTAPVAGDTFVIV